MSAPLPWNSVARWVIAASLAGLFAFAATSTLLSPSTRDLGPVIGAASALVGGLLILLPLAEGRGQLVVASILTGLNGAVVLYWIQVPADHLATAIGTALIFYLTGALATLTAGVAKGLTNRAAWLLLLIVLLSASPVWLGPMIDRFQPDTATINLLIAANPLTHLAVLADVDYLRSDCFYRHSPLGGLRYDYPQPLLVLAGYLIAGTLASLSRPPARGRARQRPAGLTPLPQQPMTSENAI